MITRFGRLILPLALLFLLAGCADHPVRHLSSDISMIKVGHSTRQDVLTFLGEPDLKKKVSEKREQWIYEEEKRSSLQDVYVIGGLFSGDGYSSIVVTIEGDVVVGSVYRTADKPNLQTK